MKARLVAVVATLVSAWTVGCGSPPVERSDDPVEVSEPTIETAAQKKAKNCSGAQGCAYAACYDGCIPGSNTDYCTAYCKCRVYDHHSDMQCQLSNPYIDIKL